MTSGNVNNFVSDLVLMAKAMEELPGVRSELEHAHTQVEEYAKQVQRLEMSLIDRKHEIEALHAKVRSTEVERDDAEMRFLEADDKLVHTLDRLNQMGNIIRTVTNDIQPPKPESVAQAPAELKVKHEEAAAIPVEQSSSVTQSDRTIGVSAPPIEHGSHSLPVTSFEEVPKSDANPPQDTALEQSIETGNAATSGTASSPENVSAPTTIDSSTPVDDVGYHNEPDVGTDWTAWNAWCERMRARYGAGAWPQRPDKTAPSVA